MPSALKLILYSLVSLGMFFIAIMAFWVFLIIIGVFIIARILYLKLFNKGTITIQRYSVSHPSQGRYTGNINPHPEYTDKSYPHDNDDHYTTVIDADNLDQEYRIPKIK